MVTLLSTNQRKPHTLSGPLLQPLRDSVAEANVSPHAHSPACGSEGSITMGCLSFTPIAPFTT
jgi:hypothetical protein